MLGESLGPYRIDRELGSGGMGKVYAATGQEGVVALKVVHPHLLETPGFFKRFMREAQLGQSIRHENVVRTLDCDQEFADGKPQCFLVMEYVEGQTLSELLRELERVPEELCRHVAREICKGLSAIHDAGVVHRDLKPENVLITPDHVVKVMDLGVAKLSDEAMKLSRSGAFVGSVEYAAPEQFKGGDVDGRTDLHALGVLLYELASGVHPHRGGGFHEVLRRVCEKEPRRLGEINPQLSAFYEEVVHTLLVKDPRGRFASATQLLDVLRDGEDSAWWHERARSLQAETKRPIRRIRIPRETAVYGRDAELEKLGALFEQAKANEGQVVLIEGEAGIGKSRLVDELVARLEAEGEDLNFLFGFYPPGGAATASGAFSFAYREHFGESGSADYLAQTPVLVPAFNALLRGESAPTGVEQLTKDSLQTCFVNVTRSLAAERPTVVLIDDLHFAPDEGRALFTSLAMAVPGARVLLVGTTRPGVSSDWVTGLTRMQQTTRIELHRLGTKDLAHLLGDCFKSQQLAHALGMQIGIKSDGNPFFAFEIIRGLREGQFITQTQDGKWASTRAIDEIQIPSSVLDLVNARVAGLTEEERDLLDVACCWGFEFDPVLVGDVLGVGRIPLLKRFGQIERKHRLVRASGRNYVFDHHQVQEALYGSLHEQLREEYHAALAEALESRTNAAEKNPEALDGALCVELCEHLLSGGRGEAALRYFTAAQTHLEDGHLHARVAALTERALAVPALLQGVARAEELLRLGGINGPLDQLVRRERQEECVRQAEQLGAEAGDDALRSRALNALGFVLNRSWRSEQAEECYRRALDLAHGQPDRGTEAAITANLGTALAAQGRLSEAVEQFERSIAIAREIGDRRREAAISMNLGVMRRKQGHHDEAREHLQRALALCGEFGEKRVEANAIGNLGTVDLATGRLREAAEAFERSLALSREIGHRRGEANATGNLSDVLRRRDEPARALEHSEQALALFREIGQRRGEAIELESLGATLHALGRLSEAEEHLEAALARSRDASFRAGEASQLLALAAVLHDVGRREDGDARLQSALDLVRDLESRELEARSRLMFGSLLAAAGDADRAREQLSAVCNLARELGEPGIETLARCESALLDGGDDEDALTAFAEHEEQLGPAERRSTRLLLFRATGDRTHLTAAKHLLDDLLAKNPPEYHDSMRQNVRVNREILAAWREEFGEDDATDGNSPTESPTRAG